MLIPRIAKKLETGTVERNTFLSEAKKSSAIFFIFFRKNFDSSSKVSPKKTRKTSEMANFRLGQDNFVRPSYMYYVHLVRDCRSNRATWGSREAALNQLVQNLLWSMDLLYSQMLFSKFETPPQHRPESNRSIRSKATSTRKPEIDGTIVWRNWWML